MVPAAQLRTPHLDLARLMGLLEEVVAISLRLGRICTQRLRLRRQGHQEISPVATITHRSTTELLRLHSRRLLRLTAHLCTLHAWLNSSLRRSRRTTFPTAEHTTLCRPQDHRRAPDQIECPLVRLQVLHLWLARRLDLPGPSASVVTVSEPT